MSYLRNVVFLCLMMIGLATTAHAAHEASHQPNLVSSHTVLASDHHQYTDELWLIGSFVFSVTGLFLILRYLHHH